MIASASPFHLSFQDFEPEAQLTVSEWADAHRMLDAQNSAEPGPWHTDRTPYLKEPMDAFCDPTVREIIMQFCTQVGKTEFELNCLGFIIDHDPGPTMVVLPRDEDAKGWAAKRVRPMILNGPSLLAHTTGKEDDLAGKLYQLDRMRVKFAGANSPADLASDPCRYVLFDEVNKYPRFSGKEANPINLGEERAKTFWNRKIVKVSSPTVDTGYITVEYKKSDQRSYHVPCPRCGRYQRLSFFQEQGGGGWTRWPSFEELGIPREEWASTIRKQGLAWYECGFCHGRIEERERVGMSAVGVWCPKGCEVNAKGKLIGDPPSTDVRGYQLSTLYSPWVSWSETAAEFLESKDKNESLMNFYNSWLGETWKSTAEEVKENNVKDRPRLHKYGLIPKNAVVLTGSIDVQKDHFWFAVRAWGVGEESWLIRYGSVETWRELLEVVTIGYLQERQTEFPLRRLVLIDSGFRTSEVYAFARDHRDIVRATKGYERQAMPIRRTHIDKDPAGRPIQGGLTLWTLDTNYFKDKLSRLIHVKHGDPGEWHLPEDQIGSDYYQQMTSEHKAQTQNKTTGKITEAWEPVTEGRANHLFDCESMNVAAAEMLQVYALKPEESAPSVYVPSSRQSWMRREQGDVRAVPMQRREGWVKR